MDNRNLRGEEVLIDEDSNTLLLTVDDSEQQGDEKLRLDDKDSTKVEEHMFTKQSSVSIEEVSKDELIMILEKRLEESLKLLEKSQKECRRKSTLLKIKNTKINDINADCLMEVLSYIQQINIFDVCDHWTNMIFNNPPLRSRSVWLKITGTILTGFLNYKTEKESLQCQTAEFFKKMWRFTPCPLIIEKGAGITILNLALDTTSTWWLDKIKEVELSCSLKEDWSLILSRFCRLEKLTINSDESKDKYLFSYPRSSVSNYIRSANCLRSLCVTGFQYNYSEADLVDILVENSNKSKGGLNEIKITTCQQSMSPLPVKEIISLIEKAKFNAVVSISSDLIGPPVAFIKWLNSKSDDGDLNSLETLPVPSTSPTETLSGLEDEESPFSCPDEHKFQFNFRGSKFDVHFRSYHN